LQKIVITKRYLTITNFGKSVHLGMQIGNGHNEFNVGFVIAIENDGVRAELAARPE